MSHRMHASLLLLLSAAVFAPGCCLVEEKPTYLTDPTMLAGSMPRELNKVTLPEYVIEPPDIVSIDALTTLPRSPYHLNVLDVLLVQVVIENGERPIDGAFSIELDGSIRFGSPYDDVTRNADPALRIDGPPMIAGLTVDEAKEVIVRHLRKTFRNPAIRVSLGQIAGLQQIAGEHLVAQDGRVNLGMYGSVAVTGLTLQQAKRAIEEHLSQYLLNPTVAMDVFAYNSKVYYVILQGAGLGDRVLRFPVTGNETVLDAITNVEGLTGASSTRMWVARPGRNEANGDQILPVDYAMITQRGDVATNYQLLPGDRLYLAEDELVAFDTLLGKILSPAERVLGSVLLATSTAQRIVFFRETATGGGLAP
jgi:polysaccharide export outer membrane protein